MPPLLAYKLQLYRFMRRHLWGILSNISRTLCFHNFHTCQPRHFQPWYLTKNPDFYYGSMHVHTLIQRSRFGTNRKYASKMFGVWLYISQLHLFTSSLSLFQQIHFSHYFVWPFNSMRLTFSLKHLVKQSSVLSTLPHSHLYRP